MCSFHILLVKSAKIEYKVGLTEATEIKICMQLYNTNAVLSHDDNTLREQIVIMRNQEVRCNIPCKTRESKESCLLGPRRH